MDKKIRRTPGASRLEQMLRQYELCCLMLNGFSVIEMTLGKRVHERVEDGLYDVELLRRELLKVRPRSDVSEVQKKFVHVEDDFEFLGYLRFAPDFLLDWTSASRRVYSLSSGTQELINATSIGTLCWDDIEFPFECFVIALEDPLFPENQNLRTDTLIVSNHDGRLNVIGLPRSYSDYIFVGEKTEQRLRSLIDAQVALLKERVNRGFSMRAPEADPRAPLGILHVLRAEAGRIKELAQLLHTHGFKLRPDGQPLLVLVKANMAEAGKDPIAGISKEKLPEDYGKHLKGVGVEYAEGVLSILKLVATFCLYLEAHQQGKVPITLSDSRFGNRQQVRQSGLQHSIRELAEVCDVQSTMVVGASSGHSRGDGTGASKTPHFRCFHKRRRPGQGSDPNARKTVPVIATIVNASKLGDGELPVGAEARLKN